MKNTQLISMFLLAVLSIVSCQKEALILPEESAEVAKKASPTYNLKNWMGAIGNNTIISRITIPGTHDSGALHESIRGTAKCQSLTIAQQLDAGVRFLDVRCRHYNNTFEIHHGSVYQKINFDNVLNACWTFLQKNPTETIIMSVKDEHTASGNNRSYEQTFNSYVNKKRSGWYLGGGLPKLGDVRGKIVLLRRFAKNSGTLGIAASNWPDNTSFTISGNNNVVIRVQDQYKVSNNTNKWNAVTTRFNQSVVDNGNTLYLNYTSGYKPLIFGIPSITSTSNTINPRVTSYFSSHTSGRYGIVIGDFATASRNGLIVATNF